MGRNKAPRYDGYTPASASASFAKRRSRAKDSLVELMLRKELWSRGLRYRLHVADLPGKPDLAFLRLRVVVFIDGDFWHGRNWEELKIKLRRRANSDYWIAKIHYNRARDRDQVEHLEELGWKVIRIWETDIKKDVKKAAERVQETIRARSSQ